MTTVSWTIAAGTDDTFEASTGLITTSGLTVNPDGDNEYGLLWWDNITVPQGTVVDSATLTVSHTSIADTLSATLHFDDADNASAPTSTNSDISGRTRTSASVVFGNAGAGIKAYDVSSLVQEVLLRAGWSSGNAMAAIIVGTGPSRDDPEIDSYEGGYASELSISYGAVDPPGPGPSSGNERKQTRGSRRGIARGTVG